MKMQRRSADFMSFKSSLVVKRSNEERLQLRQLDACLAQLEELHERGAKVVPIALAGRLSTRVACIKPDMRITDALRVVLQAQEKYLVHSMTFSQDTHPAAGDMTTAGVPSTATRGIDSPSQWLDAGAARELTDRIKASADQLWVLLLEAHERRAWVALGYASWAAYVRAEFHISRSRSYQLLDQGRVIRALQSVSTSVDISEAQARDLKPRLAAVTEAVRSRVAAEASGSVADTVAQVVEDERQRSVGQRLRARGTARRDIRPDPERDGSTAAHETPYAWGSFVTEEHEHHREHTTVLSRLDHAIRALASMPPVPDILSHILTHQHDLFDQLAPALRWLTELVELWEEAAPLRDPIRARLPCRAPVAHSEPGLCPAPLAASPASPA
jgi:hypothetical protein